MIALKKTLDERGAEEEGQKRNQWNRVEEKTKYIQYMSLMKRDKMGMMQCDCVWNVLTEAKEIIWTNRSNSVNNFVTSVVSNGFGCKVSLKIAVFSDDINLTPTSYLCYTQPQPNLNPHPSHGWRRNRKQHFNEWETLFIQKEIRLKHKTCLQRVHKPEYSWV